MIDHNIIDPQKFEEAVEEAIKSELPSEKFALLRMYINEQSTKCFCLWEAPSINELKKIIEPVNRGYSNNEYWEVESFVLQDEYRK